MEADELGKQEIVNIRDYIQKVEAGFKDLDKKLQDIREWQIRAEEQQKHYVTDAILNNRITPLENRIQVIEQKSPNYIQRSTVSEKIIGSILAIGIAVLTAYITAWLVK